MPQTYSYSFQMTVKHTCFFLKKQKHFRRKESNLIIYFLKQNLRIRIKKWDIKWFVIIIKI